MGGVDMHPKLIYLSNDFASNIDPYDSEFISCSQDVTFDSAGQQKIVNTGLISDAYQQAALPFRGSLTK